VPAIVALSASVTKNLFISTLLLVAYITPRNAKPIKTR